MTRIDIQVYLIITITFHNRSPTATRCSCLCIWNMNILLSNIIIVIHYYLLVVSVVIMLIIFFSKIGDISTFTVWGTRNDTTDDQTICGYHVPIYNVGIICDIIRILFWDLEHLNNGILILIFMIVIKL